MPSNAEYLLLGLAVIAINGWSGDQHPDADPCCRAELASSISTSAKP